jgi:hypothetical protein
MNMYRERARRAVFFLDKGLAWLIGRQSSVNRLCWSVRRSVFETASLRVGRPSAHRQTVRPPVRLACLNGPARENVPVRQDVGRRTRKTACDLRAE